MKSAEATLQHNSKTVTAIWCGLVYCKAGDVFITSEALWERCVRRERWLRLIGQNVPILQCSPAVVRLHSVSQCGQVVEVELIRRLVVKRRVRSLLVEKHKILL